MGEKIYRMEIKCRSQMGEFQIVNINAIKDKPIFISDPKHENYNFKEKDFKKEVYN